MRASPVGSLERGAPEGTGAHVCDITFQLHGPLQFTECVHIQSKLILLKNSVRYSHFGDEKLRFTVFKGHVFSISACLYHSTACSPW